ncbi:MAG: DUF4295 domain-containing protein [Bacteroidota bacterium]
MAKKVVATLQKQGSKHLAKIIRSIRSPKTGAYTFREEIMPTELVKEVLAKKA